MTIKQFLLIIGGATLLCWGAWGVVLWNIDPFQASILNMAFFYISFFLALTGTIATACYGWYHFFGDVQIPVFRYVKKSTKQGVSIAGIITVLLYLQGIGALTVWTGIFILLVIALFVSLLFSKKQSYHI
ncbi:MAG: hypothetical protein COV60_00585 [Candidatus Magasanikbacteria bacterium CG11_big_fil_rev_8_21_14_0_20_43_7]|uniref:Uncharacterized protein n=1 Tax=Candidatus Magasanikbacteria bacterium CG11_big_fil_rev_8_21_14_0_20_43_7 TaxID=1974654 RepID=A0A2H0N3B6_9BACT|nr:MAG: hypothetical protein COV60_00585 [Candidatus Magasanikbacteria bacterium CG11_big_fil_rev_8_21_14_0_20_43_7]